MSNEKKTIKLFNNIKKTNSIDILINNGGGPIPGNYLSFDHLDWQKAYDELMDFGDNYPTRRKEEAKLLFEYLKKNKK